MILGLSFREIWQRLEQRCLDDWDRIIAAIQTWAAVEHKDTGRHGAVTADSLVASGLLAGGRVSLRAIVDYDTAGATGTLAINRRDIATAGVVLLRDSNGAGDMRFGGMDCTGRINGDIVRLVSVEDNSAGGGFTIRLQQSGTTFPSNVAEFRGDPGVANDDKTVTINRWVDVMFLDRRVGGAGRYWYVQQF